MNQDNKACIQITQGNISHQRSKHIDIRHHFLRDEINANNLKMIWCPTNKMIADIMTKMLPKPRFIELRNVISRATFDKRESMVTSPIALHVRAVIDIDAASRTTAQPINEAVKELKGRSEIKIGSQSIC
jgi:hypothetical protein